MSLNWKLLLIKIKNKANLKIKDLGHKEDLQLLILDDRILSQIILDHTHFLDRQGVFLIQRQEEVHQEVLQ